MKHVFAFAENPHIGFRRGTNTRLQIRKTSKLSKFRVVQMIMNVVVKEFHSNFPGFAVLTNDKH